MKPYNPFLSAIYALSLYYDTKENKIAKRIAWLYRKLIAKGYGDSIVKSHTNGQTMLCNFAHKLPFYRKEYPLYDRQLSTLCQFIHNELKRTINIIDVGANIGDTVLNIGLKDAYYICIEGNDNFSRLINSNLKGRYNYTIEQCFLTDNPCNNNYSVETVNGTAKLINSTDTKKRKLYTLDQIINGKNSYIDLIKVDTDGFDFKVIRGAKQCLQNWKPLLYFEWDKNYCTEQVEDPLSIFSLLNELGYTYCILFDNYGNFFDYTSTKDIDRLNEFIENTNKENFPYYYDVLAINKYGKFTPDQLLTLYK